ARYGSMDEQIKIIQHEYSDRLKRLSNTENQKLIMAERDQKIDDISKVFSSDDDVTERIITEREQLIESFEIKLENNLEAFRYFFTNPQTGRVYTNVQLSGFETEEDSLNKENMQYITDYAIYGFEQFNHLNKQMEQLFQDHIEEGWYEGKIAVPKALSEYSPMMKKYTQYRQSQLIVWLAVILGIISWIFSFHLGKKTKDIPAYHRIPIDIQFMLFILTGLAGGFLLITGAKQLPHLLQLHIPASRINFWAAFSLSIIPVGLTVGQGRIITREIKDWNRFKISIKESSLYKTKYIFQDAFMNRKVGTQIFLFIGFVFILGTGMMTTFGPPIVFFI